MTEKEAKSLTTGNAESDNNQVVMTQELFNFYYNITHSLKLVIVNPYISSVLESDVFRAWCKRAKTFLISKKKDESNEAVLYYKDISTGDGAFLELKSKLEDEKVKVYHPASCDILQSPNIFWQCLEDFSTLAVAPRGAKCRYDWEIAKKIVIIENIPESCTEEELVKQFSEASNVICFPHAEAKFGFAALEFDMDAKATKFLQKHTKSGTEIEGQKVAATSLSAKLIQWKKEEEKCKKKEEIKNIELSDQERVAKRQKVKEHEEKQMSTINSEDCFGEEKIFQHLKMQQEIKPLLLEVTADGKRRKDKKLPFPEGEEIEVMSSSKGEPKKELKRSISESAYHVGPPSKKKSANDPDRNYGITSSLEIKIDDNMSPAAARMRIQRILNERLQSRMEPQTQNKQGPNKPGTGGMGARNMPMNEGNMRMNQGFVGRGERFMEMNDWSMGMSDECLGMDGGGFGMSGGMMGMNEGFTDMDPGYLGMNEGFGGMDEGSMGMDEGFGGMDECYMGMDGGSVGMNEGFGGMDECYMGMDGGSVGMNEGTGEMDRFVGLIENFIDMGVLSVNKQLAGSGTGMMTQRLGKQVGRADKAGTIRDQIQNSLNMRLNMRMKGMSDDEIDMCLQNSGMQSVDETMIMNDPSMGGMGTAGDLNMGMMNQISNEGLIEDFMQANNMGTVNDKDRLRETIQKTLNERLARRGMELNMGSGANMGGGGNMGNKGNRGNMGNMGSGGNMGNTGSRGNARNMGNMGRGGNTGNIGNMRGNFGNMGSGGSLRNDGSRNMGNMGYMGRGSNTGNMRPGGTMGNIGRAVKMERGGYTENMGGGGNMGRGGHGGNMSNMGRGDNMGFIGRGNMGRGGNMGNFGRGGSMGNMGRGGTMGRGNNASVTQGGSSGNVGPRPQQFKQVISSLNDQLKQSIAVLDRRQKTTGSGWQ